MKLLWAVFLLAFAQMAAATPQSPSERVQLFATCAGRYSALAEYQRLMDGPASEVADAQRARFDDLLDAVMPDALEWGMPGDMAMNWRITAKMAQAQLLSRGTFQTDRDIAAHAKRAAQAFLQECNAIILDI
jgi:hypothetical protein